MVIVEPMDVGPMGTMVVALDPEGNPFGLWQAGRHTGVRVYGEHGALAWNEAMVRDSTAAREFYAAVFAFSFHALGPEAGGGEGMDYTTFSTAGNPLGGLGGAQDGMPTPLADLLLGESTDEAVAAVGARGGRVTMAPMDTPFGRFAVV